ncbi:MAG: MinD/ParA family protein [Spirochaetaceae bacterium]|nr:MAG: MinD/ParA family protein [Spirochaetaceae bacterium]
MRILPVAGGKGGVGKSLIAANLAVALSRAGKRVILVDLDLGGSNLHLILGVRNPPVGIGTWLNDSRRPFDEILLQTEYRGLRFIAGDAEIPGIANLGTAQKNMLVRRLGQLDADLLIVDLGAGTHFNILDFFLMSGRGLIVTTPTPTATVNAYLFLKNLVFRIIHTSFERKSPGAEYLAGLRKQKESFQRVYIPRLLEQIAEVDPQGHAALRARLAAFRPRLIMNMLEDPKDGEKANRLRRSCEQYLGIELEHLGIMYRDDIQDVALSSGLPVVVYKPNSVLSQAVERVADKIIQLETDDDTGWHGVDESYQEAGMEAEADFETKMDYVEDLMQTGALSTGDLIETVKSQQVEINSLRKQNALYKAKLVQALQQGRPPER